jgi:hypothetical protein
MSPLSHVKLTRLAQLEGFRTKEALLHIYIREITVPGICFRSDCDGIAEVARDERAGVCPTCGYNTVQSCLVISGLI